MHKQCTGSSLIFWLPVLCLALGPTASAVDDEAPALEPSALESPAAPPSNAASLIPANTPPTLKALGGAVRLGGHLVLAAYATDADSSLVQVLAALHLRPGQPAPAWLEQTRWASPLAPFPLLEIAVSPPADAAPETYVIEVSATDDGGLSALGEMLLEVLPPEAPPPVPSPASAQGASSSSAAAVGGASSGAAGAAAAKAASSSSSESPSLSLSVSPASVAEGSIRDIVVTGTLMGVSMVPGVDVTGALQVSGTATDGTDYSLSGTKSLVIPAGSATLTGTRTLRLSALGDVRERESDETVKFKVTQVTRGTEVLALSSAAKTSVTITNVYAKPPKVSGVTAQTASDRRRGFGRRDLGRYRHRRGVGQRRRDRRVRGSGGPNGNFGPGRPGGVPGAGSGRRRMMQSTFRMVWAVLLLACLPGFAGASEGAGLFSVDAGAEPLHWPARRLPAEGFAAGGVPHGSAFPESPSSGELRSRSARMDLGRLSSARLDAERGNPVRLRLNLFADAEFEAVIERTAPTASGYTLTGHLADEPLSMVVVAVNGEHVAGTVWSSRGFHSIRATGTAALVRQLDPAALGRCEVEEASAPKTAAALGDVHRADDAHPADDGSVIDVLVVYPALARKNEGGHRAMRAFIDQEVAMVNEAYRVSDVTQRIKLVAAVETDLPLSVVEEDPQNIVDKLAAKSDGQMDEVHALRDSYAADLVALHLGSDRFIVPSGVAYAILLRPDLPDASIAAFSVSSSGLGTFAHELGHNMGLHHDRPEVYGGFGGLAITLQELFYPYSYGYTADNPSSDGPDWATIMSYDGLPIPRFSNPRQKYPDESGVPLGVPGEEWTTDVDGPADAVRSLNNTRRLVANHRASAARCAYALSPPPPEVPASGGEYLVRVEAAPGCAWTARADGDGFAEVTAGGSGVGNGEVAYRVVANEGFEREASILIAGEVYPAVQAGPQVRVVKPVCERSASVQNAIYNAIYEALPSRPGSWSCRDVTAADLAGIRALTAVGWGSDGLRLEPDEFTGLHNLRSLTLIVSTEASNRNITLEPGAFAGLANLARLRLFGTVAALEPGTFAGLPNLRELRMDAFNGPLLPGTFAELPNLRELRMDAFNGPLLPGTFAGLPNLRELRMNALQEPLLRKGTFEGLPNLNRLSLGRSDQLAELEKGVFNPLPNLDSLALWSNRLTSLQPGLFGALSKLRVLNLIGNDLESLESGVFEGLGNLQILYLESNRLTNLQPGLFDGLSNLKTLLLEDNRLTNLQPGLFGTLPNLQYLNLRRNDLASLDPGAFDGIRNLRGLYLEDNRLTALEKGVLGHWPSLQHLYLDGNGLNALDRSLFSSDTLSIARLHLGRNNLRTLEGGLMGLLHELELSGESTLASLRLDANQLETLPPGLFKGLSRLRQLDLRRNSGAPFILSAELVALPASVSATGRPDAIVAEVAEGAPFDIAVSLSASGARLSAEQAVIPKGRTRSEPVSVAPFGVAPAVIRLARSRDASVPPSCSEGEWQEYAAICYGGVRAVAGPPLVLHGLADQTLAVDGAVKFHLPSAFPDFGAGTSYTVASSNPATVEATVREGLLIVSAASGGKTTLTVTATDPNSGLSATLSFKVTAEQSIIRSRWGGWRSALLKPSS